MVEIRWKQLPLEQIVDFYDFYIRKRLDYDQTLAWRFGDAPGKLHKVNARKDAASECLLAAVLADWYGHTETADKFVKLGLQLEPDLDIRRFFPPQSSSGDVGSQHPQDGGDSRRGHDAKWSHPDGKRPP